MLLLLLLIIIIITQYFLILMLLLLLLIIMDRSCVPAQTSKSLGSKTTSIISLLKLVLNCPQTVNYSLLSTANSARPSKIHNKKKKTCYYSNLVQLIFSCQYFTYQYRNFNVGPIKVLDTILVMGISFASGSDWISKSLIVKRAKNTKSVKDKCPTSTILLPPSYRQTPITLRNRHLRDKHAETTMPMTDTWPCQIDRTLPY